MSETPRGISNQRRRGKYANLLIVGGVLAAMAAVLAFAARDAWRAGDVGPAVVAKPQAAAEARAERKPAQIAESSVIDDDGESLWVSPTDGRPLDLAYLPPGVEIILALRPRAILSTGEAAKIVAALGPDGEAVIGTVEKSVGVPLHEVERLLVGWQVDRDGNYIPTFVVTTAEPTEAPAKSFQPKSKNGNVTVVAPSSALVDIQELSGGAPPLSRDLERLLAHTDAERSVTLIAPRSLLRDENSAFVGKLGPLRSALEDALGPDTAAFALSLDSRDNFFAEVLAVPTLESSPAKLSDQIAQHVQAWPEDVERTTLRLQTSPYGRRVVARLPEMVRRLAAYTRHGYDRDVAILRCYLPVIAGHNLLMAAELALAEGQGRGKTVAANQPTAEPAEAKSIAERLQRKTTLRFGREELEAALLMLAEDVGVPITIRGQDLQLDGITRNQLFAIDLADRPAGEILVEILRRANPDKTVTGPADPRQKLVYVVGASGIIITTRSQAAARGEELPAAFRAE